MTSYYNSTMHFTILTVSFVPAHKYFPRNWTNTCVSTVPNIKYAVTSHPFSNWKKSLPICILRSAASRWVGTQLSFWLKGMKNCYLWGLRDLNFWTKFRFWTNFLTQYEALELNFSPLLRLWNANVYFQKIVFSDKCRVTGNWKILKWGS